MKLNTRSPKDVFFLDKSPAHKRSVLEAVQKILSARDQQGPLKDWEVYQAFVRACMIVSRVESGEQVSVSVCLRVAVQRSYVDVNMLAIMSSAGCGAALAEYPCE
jgi:hypothetical protein